MDEFLPVMKIKELRNGLTDNSSDKASVSIPSNILLEIVT